jgi:serine/threonine protein kinase
MNSNDADLCAFDEVQHREKVMAALTYRLQGTLNVARLEDAYEDDTHVHIVMELCEGGELIHRIGSSHYSERTVGGAALPDAHTRDAFLDHRTFMHLCPVVRPFVGSCLSGRLHRQ